MILKRKGTSEDPFLKLKQTLVVNRNYIQLKEIPNRFDRISISSYFEVEDGISNEKEYLVDYTNGVIYFHHSQNGKSLTVEYLGEGVILLPDSRVFVTANNLDINLKDKIVDLDRVDLEQKVRVDTLIKENPQPSEVVDLRVDRNGKSYSVARDRFNFEQKIVEDAYKSSDDLVLLPDLHSRLLFDYNQINEKMDSNHKQINEKVDRNHKEINNKVDNNHNETTSKITDLNEFRKKAEKSIDSLENIVKNIKHFEAKGDGKTNDADIVEQATRQLSESGGGTLFFPNGKYIIKKDTLRLYSNVKWKLDDNAVLQVSGTLLRGFATGKGYDGGIKNFSIEGGTVSGDYNRYKQKLDKGCKFLIHHGRYLTFKNVNFVEMAIGHCLDFCGCSDILIDNCTFKGRYDGIDPSNQYSECVQLDHSTHIGLGYDDESQYEDGLPTSNVIIQDCKFLPILNSNGSMKYYAPCPIGNHTQMGKAPNNIIIRNNYFEGVHDISATDWASKFSGWIHFSTVFDIIIEGNIFNNIYGTKGAAFTCRERRVHDKRHGDHLDPQNDSIKNVTFRNNEIRGFTAGGQKGMVGLVTVACWYGVHIVTNISITGNRFIKCGKRTNWNNNSMTSIDCIDLRGVRKAFIDSNYFYDVDRPIFTRKPNDNPNWEEETSMMISNNYIDGVYYNTMNISHFKGLLTVHGNEMRNIAGSCRIAGNGGKVVIKDNVLETSNLYNLANGSGDISTNFMERMFSVNAGQRGREVLVMGNVGLCGTNVWKCLISLSQPSLTKLRLGQNITDTLRVEQNY